jgi:hypothetical protein
MRHFVLEVENIVGRLKIYKNKHLAEYGSNYEFLSLFNGLTESEIIRLKDEQKGEQKDFKDIFVVCRQLRLRLNEYGKLNDEVLYILRKLEINTLKIQLTKELKRIIDALLLSIFESNKTKLQTVKHS